MKVKHVLECQFGSWCAKLKEVSIPSVIIPLSSDIVEWLINGKFETGSTKCSMDEFPDSDSMFTKEDLQSSQNSEKIVRFF